MKLTRRTLLQSAAAATLFPWTKALGAGGPAKKLLLFYTPHGTVWSQWRPTGTETNFTLSPILAPLQAHKGRLLILDGASVPYGTSYYVPHIYTMPALWTGSPIDTQSSLFNHPGHPGQSFGWGTGVSVDQHIATELAVTTPFKTLELGVSCGSLRPANRMIYRAPGQVKNPLDSPQGAFDSVFGISAPVPDASAEVKRKKRRTSVLDTVLADMQSRQAVLSSQDRARLDAHATAVRELELRLQAEAPACAKPAAPTGVNAETAIDRQLELAAAALGCGLTRIVSMQVRIADNDASLYPWVGLDTLGHHEWSHDNSAAAPNTLAKVYTWYAQRFAHLLDRLAATPDAAGGSVLDNTIVIWGSEIGVGRSHDANNVPFILAGGAQSGLRGGRYVKVTNTTNHRLLVTACHAMGLTSVQKYGSLDSGSGPLPGALS